MTSMDLAFGPGRRINWSAAGLAGTLGGAALLGLLPFVWTVHLFPMTSLDSELVAAMCLAFGMISCGFLTRREPSLRWPLPSLLLGLIAIAVVQNALGMLAYTQQLIRLALFAMAMLGAYAFGRRIVAADRLQETTTLLAAAVLVGGVFSVLVQWLQLFDAEILPFWLALVYKSAAVQPRPFGNLAQANHLTTYLAMAAFAALYLSARTRRHWFIAPSLLALSTGLALAGSRMGVLFLALAVAAIFGRTALRIESNRWRWVGAAALVLGYIGGLVAVRATAGDVDTLTRFVHDADSGAIRRELWWQAWQVAWQHPLLGVGIGQFPGGQYWVARPGPAVIVATNCHNVVLQPAAEFGWPAAIAGCAVGLSWLVRDLGARLMRPESALAWCVMVLIAIHSLLEFPLWHLYFAIPASLLFALAEPESQTALRLDLQRILPVAGVATLGICLAYHVNYLPVAIAGAPFWLEAQNLRKRIPEDALAVITVADSKLFAPEVDRLLIDLRHPSDEHTSGPMERTARVLRVLPAPVVISQYVVFLARAGRIDDAIVHARRLRIFAGGEYAADRDWILEQTRDLGPDGAALRHLLREPL